VTYDFEICRWIFITPNMHTAIEQKDELGLLLKHVEAVSLDLEAESNVHDLVTQQCGGRKEHIEYSTGVVNFSPAAKQDLSDQ
jgi:hypothetical protein